jgi:hypothetical protein
VQWTLSRGFFDEKDWLDAIVAGTNYANFFIINEVPCMPQAGETWKWSHNA